MFLFYKSLYGILSALVHFDKVMFIKIHVCAYYAQEIEAAVIDGNGTETGHIIVTTIGGKNGQPKQVSF